jgi:hypothetical protein
MSSLVLVSFYKIGASETSEMQIHSGELTDKDKDNRQVWVHKLKKLDRRIQLYMLLLISLLSLCLLNDPSYPTDVFVLCYHAQK